MSTCRPWLCPQIHQIVPLITLGKRKGALTPEELLRQVSIAHKLGEMAETYDFGKEEEEKWLTWSVEKLLKVVQEPAFTSGLNDGGRAEGERERECRYYWRTSTYRSG
jgi:hypothetical protein